MKARVKKELFFGYDFSDFMLCVLIVLVALAVYILATTGMVLGVRSLIVGGRVVLGWVFSGCFAILNVGLAVLEVALLKELL